MIKNIKGIILLIWFLVCIFMIKDKIFSDTEKAYYIPAVGYEFTHGMAPEEIINMDEFNQDACIIAQTLWGECRGLTLYEQSLVVWCILNRVDSPLYPDTIRDVITAPKQFVGFKPNNPIDQVEYDLAVDVLLRWSYERYSKGDIGRTLPKEYTCFRGKNGHNWFRDDNGTRFLFESNIDPYGDRYLGLPSEDYIIDKM